MKALFICEKPSQAQALAEALSGGFNKREGYYEGLDGKIYTFARGHFVTCQLPGEINPLWSFSGEVSSWPFFIRDMPLKLVDDPFIKKQYKVITTLMKSAETIYVSTDAGREGEHIFRNIYKLSGSNKPFQRLWMRDQTKEGLLKAFQTAKEGHEYDGLALAGQLREEADILIGINATQMATVLSNSKSAISLGRVQTPTLAMIVARDKLIENFSKTVHFSIVAKTKEGVSFELVLNKEEYLTSNQVTEILACLNSHSRTKYELIEKEENEKPKSLFNLTDLQKHMNTKFKWSASYTLENTQALYDKKYVTYPRTSAKHLASDSELPRILNSHSDNEFVKRIIQNSYRIEPSFINAEKVSDHEAITITKNVAKDLSADEQLLYDNILTRFTAAFYPPAVKNQVTATFYDGEYIFQAKETTLKGLGWRELYGAELTNGNLFHVQFDDIGEYEMIEKETRAPANYTESTLLGDMENAGKFLENKADQKVLKESEGIGTVATRASIIELLCKRLFVEKKNNQITSTKLGRALIEMFPENFSLYSPKLTAILETQLAQIELGQLTKNEFYAELSQQIEQMGKEIKENIKNICGIESKEIVGVCPKCGSSIYENSKAYSCSGYREGCKVSLWKNGLERLGKKNITLSEAKQLLAGKVVNVRLKSVKTGNVYKKDVRFNFEKGWVSF